MRPHLTIVADDSPLQRKVQHPRLSESGWVVCDQVDEDRGQEAMVIDFPAKAGRGSDGAARPLANSTPPLIVITVHKQSRLMWYESLHREPQAHEEELASIVRDSVLHVVPSQNRSRAESLVSQLTFMERQDHDYYQNDDAGSDALAAFAYRQRRREDILDEIDSLRSHD